MLLPTHFEQFIANIQPTQDRITAISEAHTTPLSIAFSPVPAPAKDANISLSLQATEVSSDRALPLPAKSC